MRTLPLRFTAALLAAFASTFATAAEIKVISSIGMKAVLEELKPQFERASPHTLAITFGTAAPLKRQIESGETFDVAILTPPMIDDLAKQGKVAPATVANVAKSGIGVAVGKGKSKPDIATSEAFKRTLLGSKSIAYTKEGQSGTALARLVERMGVAEEMKPKTVLETRSGGSILAVVEGKSELGFALISEILPNPDVDLVGPLPPELQSFVVFTAGVSPAARDASASRAFIDFLRGSAALPVLKSKGMEGS